MQFVYPIQALLLYLSLFFAPADTERIVFHGVDRSGVLIRDAAGWNLAGPEGNTSVTLEGTRIISKGSDPGIVHIHDLVNQVGGIPGHDWEKQPMLSLADDQNIKAVVVERTSDGFKVRHDRREQGIYAYTIAYIRKGAESDATCNVLGAVKQPGIVPLAEGDTLRSVLLKAGGATGITLPHRVSLLRGAPGKSPSSYETFDVAALLEGRGGNPPVLDHDTLYVAPTVLLALARDGSLAVDGEHCPAAELPTRLRDRVGAGVRSATLTAPSLTPAAEIQPLRDACAAAGIPSGDVILKMDAVPD